MSNFVINPYSFVAAVSYPDSLGTDGNLTSESCISLNTSDEKFGDGCLEGDGSCNCYGASGQNFLPDTYTAFTFGGWINPSEEATQYCGVLTNNDGNTNNFSGITTHAATKEFRCVVGDDGQNAHVRSTTTYSTGTWYNVLVVYDGSETGTDRVKLYVNGVEEGTADATADSSYTVDTECFLFQQDGAQTSSRFNGLLDDWVVAKRAFSSSECSDIGSGSGALISSLDNKNGIVAYFPMDTLTSNTVVNQALPVG